MYILLLISLVIIIVALIVYLYWPEKADEHFANLQSNEDVVISIYQEVLDRMPNQSELIKSTRELNDGLMTECILRQRLIDSDEYSRSMKTQSNSLRPELERMISDRKLLIEIAQVYQSTRQKPMPGGMGLPLKDIFISLNYNVPALQSVLGDASFAYFEKDVLSSPLDKEQLITLFDTTFPMVIAKRGTYKPTDSCPGNGDNKGPGAVGGNLPLASGTTTTTTTTQGDTMDPMLQAILKNALDEFNKDKAAQKLCSNTSPTCAPTTCAKQPTIRLYEPTHQGDMVLRPEYAWSVPGQRTPVCTSLGMPNKTGPTVVESPSSLLGTDLKEAVNDTSVGSIMPKFEYRPYVELPLTSIPTKK